MDTENGPQRRHGTRVRGRPPNPELRTAKHRRMLHAAMDLFVEHGYEHVTVEQIARRAGQSKGAFYWYFKDKEECLGQIVKAYAQKMDAALAQALTATETSARERLLKVSDYRRWSDDDFQRFILLLNSMSHSRSSAVRNMALDLASNWMRNGYNMARKLGKEAARESGWPPERLAKFDFDVWAFLYLSCFNGIYSGLQFGFFDKPPDTERIAEAIHRAFIRPLVEGTGEARKNATQ